MYAEHFSLQYFRLYVTIFVFKIGIIEITLDCYFFISCQNSGQKFMYFVHKNRFSGILRNKFWGGYKNYVNCEICKNPVILLYLILF